MTSGTILAGAGAAVGRLRRELDLDGGDFFARFRAGRCRAIRDAKVFFARRASFRAFFAARSTDLNAFLAAFHFDFAARAAFFAALASESARSAVARASLTDLGFCLDFCGLRFIFQYLHAPEPAMPKSLRLGTHGV